MNGKIHFLSVVCVVATILLSGCDRETPQTRTVPAVDPGVLAIIGGEAVTTAQVVEVVRVQAKIAELAGRKITSKRFPGWANSFAARMAPGLVQSYLLEKDLLSQGFAPTAESDAVVLKKYNRLTKKDAASFDELALLFGNEEDSFRKQFRRESVFEAFYASHSNELAVTDQALEEFYQMQTNRMVRARQISENGRKKARAVHARLAAGEPWEKVAKESSEDAEVEPTNADNWKEWITIPLDKIESQELASAVGRLKAGAFTEPVDIDEGMVIVRLNERDGELCTLSRILIRMGCEVAIPDLEEAKSQIRKKNRRELQTEELRMAHVKFRVDYPNGMNVDMTLWRVPEQTEKTSK